MSARSAVIAVVALLWVAAPADAHRLDEYLQATTVRLHRDHLGLRVRLTPGVAVADRVLAAVDADGDGVASDDEWRAYADRFGRDLSLTVDGRPVPVRLVGSTFPPVAAVRDGTGDVVLNFDAAVPAAAGHHVVLENRHRPTASVYLVNCLVPDDAGLRVTGQDRSYDQSVFRLDYAESATPAPAPAAAAAAAGRWTLARAYAYQGVHHILTGYDHLLFVTALAVAATTLWDLVKVVSTFTLAHTATLVLAAYGVVHLSGRVVEPLIAASIVFVAAQNVLWPRRARGWPRLAAAFFFGLFHGLGFAGGLLDAMRELPGASLPIALLAFSVGVEAGHQVVVLPLFAALKLTRATRPDAVARARLSMAVQRAGSAAIAVVGGYYLVVALVG